jgi:hypothetical protein
MDETYIKVKGQWRYLSNSHFGDQLVSTCGWSARPWIMKSIR